MKLQKINYSSEIVNLYFKHCLKYLLVDDAYSYLTDDLINKITSLELLVNLSDSNINYVKSVSPQPVLDINKYVNPEIHHKLVILATFSRRNFRDYRNIILEHLSKHSEKLSDYITTKRTSRLTLNGNATDFTGDHAVQLFLDYVLGNDIIIDVTLPKFNVTTNDSCLQPILGMFNSITDRLNKYLSLSTLTTMLDYIHHKCMFQYNVTTIAVTPLKKPRVETSLLTSITHINDVEGSIRDKRIVSHIESSLKRLTNTELLKTAKYSEDIRNTLNNNFKRTMKISALPFSPTEVDLDELHRLFNLSPYIHKSVLMNDHVLKNGIINVDYSQFLKSLELAYDYQYLVTSNMLSNFDVDLYIKYLSKSLKTDSVARETIVRELTKTVSEKESDLNRLRTEHSFKLDEIVKLKSINNDLLMDIERKESSTAEVNRLQTELLDLQNKYTTLEENYSNLVNVAINSTTEIVEDNLNLEELLFQVFKANPNLTLAITTRNEHFVNYYNKFPNIKVIKVWSKQFDTKPLSNVDIVFIDTNRAKHSITEKVLNCVNSKCQVHTCVTTNIYLTNKYILKKLEDGGYHEIKI